ncbi:ATP-dependent Clp protease ATP-binding subunit clpA-like protein [Auxenochlorella protothecoides]|uniref:ATP-dependent Clp protease ATP-binding subunit clpA-like protein n=1 Tax=Auxenochlorella protothecoides TaxID=3075 RepID=A0A087SED5_AUXPR|nr:ATP-dependent Clp protease ATP-binding subunit clpA-like protein [Auxenochlorella protothecoides]KFM24089.1 ATP-dependent Clp protease ATP-binding subunit clpA-like protein [Auxenochlorella protothecoides]
MLAQQLARDMSSNEVGTDHLILGLIAEASNKPSAGSLATHVQLEDAKAAVKGMHSRSRRRPPPNELHFTRDARRVFSVALQESQRMGMSFVTPDHLVLGMVGCRDDAALRLLRALRLDPRRMVAEALGRLRDQAVEEGTQRARRGVFCREAEIARLMQVLARRRKSCPVLLGEAGVGKTAIVEGLARCIATGSGGLAGQPLPLFLKGMRVLSLDLARLMAGTRERGELEARLTGLVAEAGAAPDVILFVDEIHQLVGGGAALAGRGGMGGGGGPDLAALFKPALARGRLRCVGATTEREFRRHFERDPALESALDVLDEAGSLVRVLKHRARRARCEEETEARAAAHAGYLEVLATARDCAAAGHYEEAGLLARRRGELEARLGGEARRDPVLPRVTPEHVARVVSAATGVPFEELDRIVGQDAACQAAARALTRSGAGLRDPGRPQAGLLFVGPPGCGKGLLAEALGERRFGGSVLRLDMSECGQRHSVSRLLGAPPGYQGRRPHSLVILDSIEKAHPHVLNLLLQILEDGRLADGSGRQVSFRQTVVILISTSHEASGRGGLGFEPAPASQAEAEAAAAQRARREILDSLKAS